MNDEIFNGMKMMKYSVNHSWKLRSPKLAFTAGLLQVLSMIVITVVNYLVIAVSESVIDVAKDFTALVIIGTFDDIFSYGNKFEKAKEVC